MQDAPVPTIITDIIDAQVHANQIGQNWRSVDLEATLEHLLIAMEAVGVTGVVIDEFTDIDAEGRMLPGAIEKDGIWRPHRPFSELALRKHPEKFRYLGRIDRLDPKLPELMRRMRDDPCGPAAIRLQAGPKRVVWSDPDFVNGGYSLVFEQAQEYGIPIFVVIAPRADLLAQYARRFPECTIVLDHMGVVSGVERPGPTEDVAARLARFDRVVELAEYPNVMVKWCHIERLASQPYPYPDVMPGLRRVVDAFGADRVMWAGDPTEARNPHKTDFPASWAESLHHLRDLPLLTQAEKAAVLGGTIRKVLNWARL